MTVGYVGILLDLSGGQERLTVEQQQALEGQLIRRKQAGAAGCPPMYPKQADKRESSNHALGS